MEVALPLLVIALLLALGAGMSLGMLGGGGSILTVPLLVYVLGLPAHEAIAASLLVVGTTSIVAVVPHARAGRVEWRTGVVFGLASMTGAFAAGRVAKMVPATVLLLSFGAMMLLTAVSMMRSRKEPAGPPKRAAPRTARSHVLILAQGLAVGAFTGLVGAGGGFFVVPALVLLGGLGMREAVGTSLLIIAMNSFAGLAGHLGATHVDWTITVLVAGAAVVGSLAGARLARTLSPDLLRRGFAWFVVVMAVFILSQEVPKAFGWRVTLHDSWPVVIGLVAVPILAAIVSLARAPRLASR